MAVNARILLVVAAALVSSCARTAPPPTIAVPAESHGAPSAVLLFVSGAHHPGEQTVANDPYFGGQVSVLYRAQYHSASGKLCRRFDVTRIGSAQSAQTFYACFTDGDWQMAGIY
jgi:hypothetical protein